MRIVAKNIYFQHLMNIGFGIPIFVISILAMLILPLPPFILDICFTFNITLSLMVLLAAIYSARPLEFSIFPMLLLLATLLRLALNIASTRVVLLHGNTGTDAAGKVVQSFGEVVIGGDYTVGFVIFMILVIINFIVVTKGATRISEVSARFTLDSMPGKQMAVDADLNAGLISQDDAKKRREEIASEADFYGAMDGASKFVRGDAVAGILILLINILGGFIIGIVQHDLSVGESFRVYGLLTIGDGLVAQIPSLLLSTAAAIIVTRVSSTQDVSSQVKKQVFYQYRPLVISGSVLLVLGLIPGMPHVVFLSIAGCLGFAAYYVFLQSQKKENKVSDLIEPPKKQLEKAEEESEISWNDVPTIDDISLEIGYKLIPLVEQKNNSDLLKRMKSLRKSISQELGFLISTIHIHDDLNLQPHAYRISLHGIIMGEGEVYPDKLLAIHHGNVTQSIKGTVAKEPVFGLDALWIEANQKEQAQTNGYTVVDPSTTIATHLNQVIKDNAEQMLGYQETQKIIDMIGAKCPKLVEDLIPDKVPLTSIVRIFQNLLNEGIYLKDPKKILEAVSANINKTQDPDLLTEYVRIALNRYIIQQLNGAKSDVKVITIDPQLEQIFMQSLQSSQNDVPILEPTLLEKFQQAVSKTAEVHSALNQNMILLVNPSLRRLLARLLKRVTKNLTVLSFKEIPDEKNIQISSVVNC